MSDINTAVMPFNEGRVALAQAARRSCCQIAGRWRWNGEDGEVRKV